MYLKMCYKHPSQSPQKSWFPDWGAVYDIISFPVPSSLPQPLLTFPHEQMQSYTILFDDVSLGWCVQHPIHDLCQGRHKAQAFRRTCQTGVFCNFLLPFSQATRERTVKSLFLDNKSKGDINTFTAFISFWILSTDRICKITREKMFITPLNILPSN